MLRMQSVLLAMTRILFEPHHHTLLAMQRGGNTIDLDEGQDPTSLLLYGSGTRWKEGDLHLKKLLKVMLRSDIATTEQFRRLV